MGWLRTTGYVERLRRGSVENIYPFSIEISAHSNGLVAVATIGKEDDLFAIESDVVLGGLDFDTTTGMGLDAGNVVIASGALAILANGVWDGDGLSVDGDDNVVSLLNVGNTGTWKTALTSKLNLVLGKDDFQFHVVGSNSRGQNSHGILTRAISGQKVRASLGDTSVDFSNSVVKAGDVLAFQLTGCCKKR